MTETIKIAAIDDSGRLRPLDPDRVALLAQSIEQGRLEQPISVRPSGEGFKLIIGGHRLGALKSLGWEELVVGEHVFVRDGDDDDTARQAEIDENLVRSSLTALEHIEFIKERKEIYDRTAAPRGRGRPTKVQKYKDEENPISIGFKFDERFSKHAAKRFGMSEKSVQQSLTLAKKLQKETVAAIRGTMVADNLQELLALGEIEGEQQIAAARVIQNGQAKTVSQARVVLDPTLKRSEDLQGRLYAEILARLTKCDLNTLKTVADEVKREMSRKRKEG